MMRRLSFYAFLGFFLNVVYAVEGGTQARFLIPEKSPDYKSYMYFEDCLAAAGRVQYFQKWNHAVVDTFVDKRQPKYLMAISQPARDTGQICSNKWTIDSVESKFINRWADDFMRLGRSVEVKKLYARYIDSIPPDERLDARGKIRDLYGMYLDEYLVDDFLEYLTEYHKHVPSDSLPLKLSSLVSFVVTGVTLWVPERADSALNDYISYLETVSPERRKTYPLLWYFAERFFPTAKVVKEPEILEKLSESTTGYSEYLKDLWKKIGHNKELILPLDSTAPGIVGKWWYEPRVTDRNLTASRLTDKPMSRPVPGKVNLIAFIESGCYSNSPKDQSGGFARLNAKHEGDRARSPMCARTITAIKRFKERYPDLEITIVTKTFGLFGSVLSGPPEAEADLFAKYLIDYYKINAHVAVVETENFRLPGLDRRRIDLPTENEDNYFIAGIRNAGHLNVLLVDPEGKIFYSGLIALGDEENVARNLIGAVMKRGK